MPICWLAVVVLNLSPDVSDLFMCKLDSITTCSPDTRNRLWNSAGLFWIAWAYHYFPFYLMNRQLFLHHYLPAHLCSALVAGAVLNFIISETINYPVSIPSPFTRRRPREYTDLGVKAVIAIVVFNLVFVFMFVFLSPLTYGTPGYVIFVF